MAKPNRHYSLPIYQDIDSAFADIELNSHKVRNEREISAAFQKIRDIYSAANDEKNRDKCQLEHEFQSFTFVEAKLSHSCSWIDGGKNIIFPDVSSYKDSDFDFLKNRLSATKNASLQARYSHILWEASKTKHIDYAKVAIDSYLISIGDLLSFELENPKKSCAERILPSVRNVWILSRSINYVQDQVVQLVVKVFTDYDFGNPSSSFVRHSILELAMANWKPLGEELAPHVEAIYLEQKKSINPDFDVEWLILLGKFDAKFKLSTMQWKSELSNVCEQIGDHFQANKNPASSHWYAKAIDVEKTSKNTSRIQLLEKKYVQSKDSLKLTEYSQPIDMTKAMTEASARATQLTKAHRGSALFLQFKLEAGVIPTKNEIEKEAQEYLAESIILQSLSQTVLDHRLNPVEHYTSPAELKIYWENSIYQNQIHSQKLPFLSYFFSLGIKNGSINVDETFKYFKEKTWLGTARKTFSPAASSTELMFDLVSPSVKYFIEENQKRISDTKYRPDFTLCIDSLTTKFEGLLRQIVEELGGKTFSMKKDSEKRDIVHEQDINWLLYKPEIVNSFSVDELMFLRFVLIEKAGLNWRHKVAHSLSFAEEYSYELMVLLMTALLIVGKKKLIE